MCTGQTPNTALLREAFPESVIPDGPDRGMARVRRTLQIAKPVDEVSCPFWRLSLSAADAEALPFSPCSAVEDEAQEDDEPQIEIEEDPSTRVAAEHVFAIGDAADAFGAINAGHNAFNQGEAAARNILRLVRRGEVEAAERAAGEGEKVEEKVVEAEVKKEEKEEGEKEEAKAAARREKEEAKERRRKEEEEERARRKQKNRPRRAPFNFEQEKPKVLNSIVEASQASSNLVNAITVSEVSHARCPSG